MDNWLFKALLVGALLMLLSLVFLMSALAYEVIEDTETCSCVDIRAEAPEARQ
jgi:hypothetical protein